jgi:hypothetical protein
MFLIPLLSYQKIYFIIDDDVIILLDNIPIEIFFEQAFKGFQEQSERKLNLIHSAIRKRLPFNVILQSITNLNIVNKLKSGKTISHNFSGKFIQKSK